MPVNDPRRRQIGQFRSVADPDEALFGPYPQGAHGLDGVRGVEVAVKLSWKVKGTPPPKYNCSLEVFELRTFVKGKEPAAEMKDRKTGGLLTWKRNKPWYDSDEFQSILECDPFLARDFGTEMEVNESALLPGNADLQKGFDFPGMYFDPSDQRSMDAIKDKLDKFDGEYSAKVLLLIVFCTECDGSEDCCKILSRLVEVNWTIKKPRIEGGIPEDEVTWNVYPLKCSQTKEQFTKLANEAAAGFEAQLLSQMPQTWWRAQLELGNITQADFDRNKLGGQYRKFGDLPAGTTFPPRATKNNVSRCFGDD
ncbi:MAG: hypothetical protein IPN34_21320 [Planctomycetes bacterium]|nr:hypothetical protein [Planctomycetota bacterium]